MTLSELKDKRDVLALSKRELETKLAAVRNLVRASGRMPQDKYRACCESQTDYTRKIIGIEAQLLPLKRQIQKLADEEHAARADANGRIPVKAIVQALREVRDRWQEFACDDALGNSTERTQAAQFVRDLNPIIHLLLDPQTAQNPST